MGGAGFFIIIIAFGFLYFVLVRPQKRRQVEQRRMLNELQVGDEVVTAGGIYGEITAVDDEDVRLRIAPELEVRVARRAIGGKVARDDESETFEEPDEPERSEPTPGT
jgi:preprotein translocase subunit YajC